MNAEFLLKREENTKYSGVDDSASTNQTCGVVILPGGIKGADESQIDLNKTTHGNVGIGSPDKSKVFVVTN